MPQKFISSILDETPETTQQYDLLDFDAVRQHTLDSVKAATIKRFPLTNSRYTLNIGDLEYDKKNFYTPAEQKDAILNGKSLGIDLKGKFSLVDNATGKPVSETARKTLLSVPYLTERGTYIRNGHEMTVGNILRLQPGVYSRVRNNGQVEAHINPESGSGMPFKVEMNPDDGVFSIRKENSKIKLYPLLKQMGITDFQLEEQWGKDILHANRNASEGAVTRTKANPNVPMNTIVKTAAVDDEERPLSTKVSTAKQNSFQELAEEFNNMKLDPQVTKMTVGKEHNNVNPYLLMDTSKKLLGISRGEQEVDTRDSMEFQKIYGAPELFAERVAKDGGKVSRNLLWKATNKGSLEFIGPRALNKHMDAVFNSSGMGQYIEGTSPMDALDGNFKVTRLGEGGITSMDAAPEEARYVRSSYMGFIDPIRSPECYDPKTEVMTSKGWKLIKDVTSDDLVACLINNTLEFNKPSEVLSFDYSGKLLGAKTDTMDYLVTPNHRMWVRPIEGNGYRWELAEEVQGKNRLFNSGKFNPAVLELEQDSFLLPLVEASGKEHQVYGNPPIGASLKNIKEPIDIYDWCEFMGWYLSEGSYSIREDTGRYVVSISQSSLANPDNCKQISALLARLPFAWNYTAQAFTISGKQLTSYCSKFGYCENKYIPEEIFAAPLAAKRLFVEAILKGDGRKDSSGRCISLCTTSKKLADDFHFLSFLMGQSSSISFEPDEREERYLGCYVVRLHTRSERAVYVKNHRHPEGQFYTEDYTGKVYCLTVPGNLLYIRRNNNQGFWCGNSIKVGLDMFLGQDVRKGSNGLLYSKFYNPKTKQTEWVDSKTAALSKIATPEYINSKAKYIPVLQGSKQIKILPKSEVDYFVANPISMFSPATNMVPMLGGIAGMRANMGSRYLSQAIPLATRETPLVTTDTGDGTGQHSKYSKYFGVNKTDAPGRVLNITDDEITVEKADKSKKTFYLYNNFPANQKGYLRSIPAVKVGQTVNPGDVISYSNYTDKQGNVAVGLNLRTAYMPYKGLNYEDGIVISEDAAQKLSSEHMNHYSLDTGAGTSADKKKFLSVYPGKFTAEQYKNIQDNGVAKKGTILHYGDPIILGVTENEPSPLSMGRRTVASRTEVWDKDYPGIVTDASSARGVAKVFIRSNAPMQVGDKLSGPYGGKGVIAHIVPQTKMPMDKDGNPLEILINPLGVVGRANPAMLIEAALGKVAQKTGKPYILPRFPNKNLVDMAQEELQKNGMTDAEDLINPETQKVIPQVFTGVNYYMKLKHTSDSKKAGRGTGGYTVDEQPASGGEEGSKRFGLLESSAMVGHGAMEILKDAKLIRGQQNDDFWRDFRMGKTPVMPGEPLAHKKFFAYLQGAGINVRKNKNTIDIFGMTDSDVNKLTGGREVKSYQTYDSKSYDPIPGGLFGRDVFGPEGDQWGHIKLPFALPNPIMEDSIKKILGITGTKFDAVMAGEDSMDGVKGPVAIGNALQKIDIDRETANAMSTLKNSSGGARDKALKRYRALASIKAQGLVPADFMLTKIPVVPPMFRPISTSGSLTMVSDANYLYKQIMHSMDDYTEAKEQLPEEYSYPLQSRIYNDYRAITGLSQPDDVKLASKNVGGLLQLVFGKGSPKYGAYQRKLIATSLDTVGRSVITPNPSLKMNEVGLPEKTAWNIYEPFVVRDLVQKGYPVTTAVQLVTDKAQPAYTSLKRVIEERPVIINRAPSLHKFSLMAFWPQLTKGNTLQVPPPIVEPFNADFDGNCCDFDSYVILKISKSALDKVRKELYCIYSSTNGGTMRTVGESTVELRQGDQMVGIRIGDIPREGNPVKDANGADVFCLPKGTEVLSFSPARGYEFSKALRLTVEEECECMDVCVGGRHVIVSSNESMAVFDPTSGVMVKAKPSIIESRLVPVLIKDPMPLGAYGDRDLGWWVGSFLSDGWRSGNTIGYAKREDSKRKAFESIARTKLSVNFTCNEYRGSSTEAGKLGNSIKIHCSGRDLASAVEALGLSISNPVDVRQSFTKTIPTKLINEGSEEFLWGMLSGLLDGDGSFSKNTALKNPRFGCRFSTSSPSLRDSLCRLLYRLGIRFSVTTTPPRNFSNEAYTVCPSTLDMFEMLDKLSCIGERERSLIAEWKNNPPTGKFKGDTVPLTCNELTSLLPICLAKDKSTYTTLTKNRQNPRLSKSLVLKLKTEIQELGLHDLLCRAELEYIVWYPIDSVTPAGNRQVFDFEVEANKVFVINEGVVIYDTLNYHVPVSSRAVQEAIDKMLPEDNLLNVREFKAHYKPIREYAQGIYLASKPVHGIPEKTFLSELEAIKAYKKGQIDLNTPVKIGQ